MAKRRQTIKQHILLVI